LAPFEGTYRNTNLSLSSLKVAQPR
jgi:hypothetical protein